jgi:hypothetical protein
MLITFTQPAADGERLAPGCLDNVIGREYPLIVDGLPDTLGTITDAVVLPGGESASLTLEVPDDSEGTQAVSAAGGGGPGPFSVGEDGSVSRSVEIRRRDPAEAAERIRAGYAEAGIPQEIAEAMIEEA